MGKESFVWTIFICWCISGALIGHVEYTYSTSIINYPPVGEYSSYSVTVNPDGSYTVDYRGHDPTVLDSETYVDTSNGVFGVGGRTTTTRNRQYVPGTPVVRESLKRERTMRGPKRYQG